MFQWLPKPIFFPINMNYTLNRKYNKYSSPFDIYLTKWGAGAGKEKYEFYIYKINKTITKKTCWNTTMKNLSSNSTDTGQ